MISSDPLPRDRARDGARDHALVLAVERDAGIRALERFFVDDAGYAVDLVEDGSEALQKARILRPRILVSEILVPGIDGLRVCRAIKDNPETAGTIVVILSMLAAEERATEAGADAYLRRPLGEAQLVHTVAELLARSCSHGGDR